MKNILAAALPMCALLCVASFAQNIPPSSTDSTGQAQPTAQAPAPGQTGGNQTQAASPLKIAPGSIIPVQLAKTIDAKKAKTGDEVVATVTQDMKTSSGEVLVPKDTRVIGHVTAAQARNKEQKESEVAIAFDHAVVKGDPVQLPMSIQAIIVPETNNPTAPRGNEQNSPAAEGTSPSAPTAGGRPGAMGGGSNPPPRQNYPQGGAPEEQSQPTTRPPITGDTQGVIGMPDVNLASSAQNAAEGSVVTSEKNNVKIEKGTLMLLRVNQ
jgi:hypothetical protein